MNDFDLQELFALADKNILISKQQESEEKREINRKKRAKKLKAEKLALSIQKLIIEVVKNAKTNCGLITDIGAISNYGEPRNKTYELDDSKLQIKLDFSYSIASDILCYTGPRGFKTDEINWKYLCELLKEKGIILEHHQTRKETGDPNYITYTNFGDVLVITVERTKKLEVEEPSVSSRKK